MVGTVQGYPLDGPGHYSFIPAYGNAAGTAGMALYGCASGDAVLAFNADLIDGSNWYYVFYGPTSHDEAHNFFLQKTTFVGANGYTGYEGEWWNWQARPLTRDKILAANWDAYLASH